MTIITDIIAAMNDAPSAIVAIEFGDSGWHAFHARARSVEELGDDLDSREDVAAIRALPHCRTHIFRGFDLILDDRPNPRRRNRRERAA